MEWVEASGTTVAIAVEAAMAELGISDPEQAVIEVLQEPKPGVLFWGKQQAIVKVSRMPAEKTGGRRRGRGGRSEEGGHQGQADRRRDGRARGEPARDRSTRRGDRRSGDRPQGDGGRGEQGGRSLRPSSGERNRRDEQRTVRQDGDGRSERKEYTAMDGPQLDEATVAEQATVAEDFIKGVLAAFGLEGTVSTRVEDDTVYLDVSGEQTEALVGGKGAVMQALLEVSRTVVQRSTSSAPRMRLDINGYAERRRQALRIYTTQLAERVLADGGEVMLEPMNAADRKVVHDTVAEIDGIRSFSEGEDPDRAVVIAPSG